MSTPGKATEPQERWVSIRRACEILGVNQVTLRHWTAAGRVRAFFTPGGHRRYLERDLLQMARGASEPREAPSLEGLLLRSRERYDSVVRHCLTATPWFRVLDAEARLRFRILGNSMLNLLSAFITASDRRERRRCLEEGKEVADQYGREAANLGLSLTEATEAFLLFRTPVLESVNHWLGAPGTASPRAGDVLKRLNQFMDEVLVALAAAHEQRRAAHPQQSSLE